MPASPSIPEKLLRIQQLIRLGDLEAAALSCAELTRLAPELPQAWFYAGVVALRRGLLPEAEQALRHSLSLDRNNADTWNNLGVALHQRGAAEEAEHCARSAVALRAHDSSLWLNLGNALFAQTRYDEAAQAYREALLHDERDPIAWGNLGAVEHKRSRLTEAKQAYERSLELSPCDARALANYARLLSDQGEPQRSVRLMHGLLSRDPGQSAGWVVLGNALKSLGDLPGAEAAYRGALELSPRHREALFSLALVFLLQWRLPEAESRIRALLNAEPQNADAWTLLGSIQQARLETREGLAAMRQALALEASPTRHSKLLASLQYADDVSPDELLDEHRRWNAAYAQPDLPAAPAAPFPSLDRHRPLRLGFVSADFARHPTGFLVLPALECLDRASCRIVCYSDSLAEDKYTARFRSAADVWRPIVGLTAGELADQVRRDQIDVLVDLSGHFGHRLLVFAQRPAPVQVTWFGYVGTTGVAAIDFLLADRFHVPPGEERHYSETVLRLPHGYACYGPPAYAPAVADSPALRTRRVTFGCFNNPVKYSGRILATWAAILNRVPTACLLLKFDGLDDSELQQQIGRSFAEQGVDPARLIIEGRSPHADLLAAYSRVDLALDTQPYSGGLTTCEALWMGVPVITCPGRTFAGRHSTSHLSNAGYPQFIAGDLPGYIDLAIHWTNRLDELATLRSEMRDQIRQSPLCNAPRFAADFLKILQQAWQSRLAAASA